MIRFLYPGRWHTGIALTTAGKTWWALWHVKSVLDYDGHVIYIHFEEPRPDGTIQRLLALGVDKEAIRKRFHWPDSRPWAAGEMARAVALLPDTPVLAVLDGINAACGIHGWDVSVASAVGEYRSMFVTPLTDLGTTVLSLGHPVKAIKRQSESYSYGAAGWLNDVDGVGYRMKASSTPIGRGQEGLQRPLLGQRQIRRGRAVGRAPGRRRDALALHGPVRGRQHAHGRPVRQGPDRLPHHHPRQGRRGRRQRQIRRPRRGDPDPPQSDHRQVPDRQLARRRPQGEG